jgi:pyrroloquinoline quinone biosynthesis protein D
MLRPRLAGFVRLQADPARGGMVLQAPERVLMLDEAAAATLKLVDGERTVAEIAALLAQDYDAPEAEIAADITALLDELAELGLVIDAGA